jgi:hypothetical protein
MIIYLLPCQRTMVISFRPEAIRSCYRTRCQAYLPVTRPKSHAYFISGKRSFWVVTGVRGHAYLPVTMSKNHAHLITSQRSFLALALVKNPSFLFVTRPKKGRTFSHEGKISPGWWEGVHAHPLSLHLPSPIKLQCTLQLSGQTQ